MCDMNTIIKSLGDKTKIDSSIHDFMTDACFKRLVNEKEFPENGFRRVILHKSKNVSIYCIYWKKGSHSPPHDHPDGGCILKVIQGKLLEKNFCLKEGMTKYVNERFISPNDVGVKYGDELHSIDGIEDTVSLHIYFPGCYCPKYYAEPKIEKY